jgi:Tol biopolymer transport system component
VTDGAFNASPRSVAFSPDDQHVAYIVSRGTGTNPYVPSDIVIRSVERGGEMRRLSPDLSRITRVFWLPDGRSLLVRGADQKGRAGLYKVALESGAVTPVYQTSAFFETPLRSRATVHEFFVA